MKKVSKLFILLVFITLSGICKSQTFTAYEFISLALQDHEDQKSSLIKKGYTYDQDEKSDMSTNYIFSGSDNMNVSIIVPNFEGSESLVSWEFYGMDSLYKKLEQQIISEGYKRVDREVRDGSRYVSSTYKRQTITITLSRDKRKNSNGTYKLSVRSINPSLYQR